MITTNKNIDGPVIIRFKNLMYLLKNPELKVMAVSKSGLVKDIDTVGEEFVYDITPAINTDGKPFLIVYTSSNTKDILDKHLLQ